MAKANGPLFSVSAKGTIGNSFFFSTWKGKKKVNKHFKPHNPRTADQQQNRQYLAGAIILWRLLSDAEKKEWEQSAITKGLKMSGYNYFISEYIKTLVIPPPPPPGPITDGLISWWKLDEGAGDSIGDSWGTNNGTKYGPIWTTGKKGSALWFDGIDDYAQVTDNGFVTGSNPRTLEFWGLQDEWRPQHAYIFDYGTFADRKRFSIHLPYSTLDMHTSENHNCGVSWLNLGLTVGIWYHYVLTLTGTTVELFINSVSKGQKTLPSTPDTTPSGVTKFGKRIDGYGGFKGKLDEIRFYSKVLSQDEINHNYAL